MGYFVEDGKSVTSKKGIREPHQEVTKEMLGHEDEKTLKYLEKRGILYQAKMPRPEEKAQKQKAADAAKKEADAEKAGAKKSADNKKPAGAKKKDDTVTTKGGDGDTGDKPGDKE